MKTNIGMVEYAKAQVGKPYWYGTYGSAASRSYYNAKKKQYPNYYKWSYTDNVEGVKVHDCIGLIKGYLMCDSPQTQNRTMIKVWICPLMGCEAVVKSKAL